VADTRSAVVLDASAVVALMLHEPGASAVAALVRSGDVRMTTVNAAEVVDVLVRVHGVDAHAAVARVEELLTTVVEAVPASLDLSITAGELRARLYVRRVSRLSLADCFVLAIADRADRIVTSDRTLATAARDEGYEVVTPA
jgi:ribonuclease VapC